MERAQAGDREAFKALYQMHASTVHRYAILPMVRDPVLAEDLLADTFVKALEHLPRFKWQGRGILPWLIRIGKNRCLDHLRRAGRQSAWPEGLEQQLPEPSQLLDPEHQVGTAEAARVIGDRIQACLEDINPRYRRVIELRLVEKLPRDVAATRMEVTVGTLDVLLFRACKAFRKSYVKRHGVTPEQPELFSP